ncbi:MAG: RNA polymerase sigma factor [Chloroflexota bacterium]|nr:RNA polymerase sigma factor [Chloroflexota bacterium]
MHRAITDQEITTLVLRCQRGEVDAVETLYELYADRLYRYLLARTGEPDVATDLTTELFVRVIDRISRFKLNRRRPAASVSAWLYRIAANMVTDHYREQQRLPQVSLNEQWPLPATRGNPEKVTEKQEEFELLSQAMTALSEDQRLVIIGKFGEDMSNAEVAAWLGKTEGAVKSLQHRALRAMARFLKREEL